MATTSCLRAKGRPGEASALLATLNTYWPSQGRWLAAGGSGSRCGDACMESSTGRWAEIECHAWNHRQGGEGRRP